MSENPRFQLYGRRKARPLRRDQARLLEDLLPRLRFEVPAGASLDPRSLFPFTPAECWLEIGFGGGEHLAWQASANPGMGLIGAEPFLNGVAKLVSLIDAGRQGNVRILDDDARPLLEALETASLSRVFILFPDPWPKARHAKRRIVNQSTLRELHRVIAPGGELRIASDSPGLVRWTLIEIARHGGFSWRAERCGDWRLRPEDQTATRYELKALKSGRVPTYLRFARRAPETELQFGPEAV